MPIKMDSRDFDHKNIPSYNLETIPKSLAENKTNPYELLDGIVSYANFQPNTFKYQT
jgi:hypothetical protein